MIHPRTPRSLEEPHPSHSQIPSHLPPTTTLDHTSLHACVREKTPHGSKRTRGCTRASAALTDCSHGVLRPFLAIPGNCTSFTAPCVSGPSSCVLPAIGNRIARPRVFIAASQLRNFQFHNWTASTKQQTDKPQTTNHKPQTTDHKPTTQQTNNQQRTINNNAHPPPDRESFIHLVL